MPLATLVLEDGTVLQGEAFGGEADTVFELVFNTSMTGYQEIITDPSYRGQAVVFTVPHIGNVGINTEDGEAAFPQVSGVVVRETSPVVSNWRAQDTLESWLAAHNIPGISEVDTRFLTRKLRDHGTMHAALSTRGTSAATLLKMAREWPGLDGLDMVKEVTCPEPYHWMGDEGSGWVREGLTTSARPRGAQPFIVLYDFGAKRNIMRHLAAWGGRITIVPADTPASDVLAMKPDGVMLSNGPGDPAGLPYAVQATRELIESEIPIFGICLGHQLIGRAMGGDTGRLKFGHHGGNHPVQDLATRQVFITAQNHNYTVLPDTLDPEKVEITHLSLNDQSVEGLRLVGKPVFSVQFHPEAAPGPHDAHPLFARFFEIMETNT